MHDLLLRGGRVIDPEQGIDGICDVAFQGGKVAAIGPKPRAKCYMRFAISLA